MLQTSAVCVCGSTRQVAKLRASQHWMGQNLTKAEKCRDDFFFSLMFAFPRLLAASLCPRSIS